MTNRVPPPRLAADRGGPSAPGWLFVWGGLLLLLAIARAVETWRIPTPVCLSRAITGIPCPFCGSTRMVVAVAHLDPSSALRFNPLAFALLVGVVFWSVVQAIEWWLARPVLSAAKAWLRRLPWLWIGLACLLLNWAYLWYASRPPAGDSTNAPSRPGRVSATG